MRRLLVAAIVIGFAGVIAVPQLVQVMAQRSVRQFVPDGAILIDGGKEATLQLSAGRHAMYGYYNSDPCTFAGDLKRPAVELTDGSDSIVTTLLGTFEVAAAGPVEFDCTTEPYGSFQIGALPAVPRGLGPLVLAPVGVLNGIGLLPGVVLAVVALARRKRSDPGRNAPVQLG